MTEGLIEMQPTERRTQNALVDRIIGGELVGTYEPYSVVSYAKTDFGISMKEERIRIRMSLRDLSDAVGLTMAELSGIEQGMYQAHLRWKTKIVDAMREFVRGNT